MGLRAEYSVSSAANRVRRRRVSLLAGYYANSADSLANVMPEIRPDSATLC